MFLSVRLGALALGLTCAGLGCYGAWEFALKLEAGTVTYLVLAAPVIAAAAALTGVMRHWSTGHYRSQSMLAYLTIPMAIGSVVGAAVGGYLAAWAPSDTVRLMLAVILAVSAVKLWTKHS